MPVLAPPSWPRYLDMPSPDLQVTGPTYSQTRRRGRLWVSTDLMHFIADYVERTLLARDVTQRDTDGRIRVYRHMSPTWYAYLYRRMQRAAEARKNGGLSETVWQSLRERFAAVHRLTLQQGWTPTELNEAVRSPEPRHYDPVPYRSPIRRRA